MAFKFNMMEALFIIGSILIGVFGIIHFFTNKQYIALMIFVPLVVWVLVIFGLRWFGADGEFKNTTVKWPPSINACPDFLVEMSRTKDGKVIKGCIDTMGISTKNTPEIYTKDRPTDDKYFFDIKPSETRSDLCKRLTEAGLTWEGIYNGQKCFEEGGSGGSNSDGTGSNCPPA